MGMRSELKNLPEHLKSVQIPTNIDLETAQIKILF